MLQRLIDGLFGCSHRRTTFPLTPARKSAPTRRGAYVVCLDCGREFAYDWSEMKVGAKLPAPAAPTWQKPKGAEDQASESVVSKKFVAG